MSKEKCIHCGINIDRGERMDLIIIDECEVCKMCDGDGVVPCDEWDDDLHCYLPGVGEQQCECQI